MGDADLQIDITDYCKYANSGFIAKKGWKPSIEGAIAGQH